MNKLDIIVYGGAIILTIAGLAFYRLSTQTKPIFCSKIGETHRLTLLSGQFDKSELTVNQCDQVTISNQDNLSYELFFGSRSNHMTYPGYYPATLQPNQSLVLTAKKPGDFEMHDHLRDSARITLHILKAKQ